MECLLEPILPAYRLMYKRNISIRTNDVGKTALSLGEDRWKKGVPLGALDFLIYVHAQQRYIPIDIALNICGLEYVKTN